MKAATFALLWVMGVATTVAGPSGPTLEALANSRQVKEEPPVVCGFRNPGYAGFCEEKMPYEKGKELKAVCKPILDCLNNPQCIKTYCGSTTIRQGWTLESAKREK
jgi:hypothetical protein